jgi:hypothetical protein
MVIFHSYVSLPEGTVPNMNIGFFLWEVLWMVAKSGYHQLRAGKHPIIYRLLTIQGGAGFLPPTVSKCIKYPRLITTRT